MIYTKAATNALAESLYRNGRQMRWPTARKLHKKWWNKIANEHWRFCDELFRLIQDLGIIDGFTTFQTASKGKAVAIKPHKCGPGCNHAKTEKNYVTGTQASAIRASFAAEFGETAAIAFDSLFEKEMNRLMIGGGQPIPQGALFNEFYYESYNEGLNAALMRAQGNGSFMSSVRTSAQNAAIRDAYKRARNRALAMGANPAVWGMDGTVYVFDPQSKYVQNLFGGTQHGYKLIRAKLSRDFLPNVQRALIDGTRQLKGGREIARDLYRQIGQGGLYHWDRLVRTEQVFAFQSAALERYEKMGVQRLFYSASADACPICAPDSGKIFAFDKVPDIPRHPNCRCTTIPVWDEGVS